MSAPETSENEKSCSTCSTSTESSSSSSEHPKPNFTEGTIINQKWQISKQLGAGGIGVVYKVERVPSLEEAKENNALKAETIDPKRRYKETLKVEALVLRRLCFSEHVCDLFMAGRLESSANVIVMTELGPSLSFLRRRCPDQHFTLSTAIRITKRAISSIEDLHAIGFIHRDIKPSNFAIGLHPHRRKLHLLDFGFARSYLTWSANSKLVHRPPRTRAPFMGTDRYCSLNVHERIEQSRRDDMWSLFFTLIELMKGKLPWRNLGRKEIPAAKKKAIPFLLERTRSPCELNLMFDHIRSLEYTSRPDYALLKKCLSDVCVHRGFLDHEPFDWEDGAHYRKYFENT
ncbi:protein kinase domain-containing protein [Ditylenchus destructor]|uniref:Protein kinase domain-containing protein n=1 Tax=Ditylenchus destructor TaxID=166010 RepID=A0AAD4RA84_9BILA|nr:protein kinase domain-containing protein [Ditylenchus destructor]